jgi:hypothetical protein
MATSATSYSPADDTAKGSLLSYALSNAPTRDPLVSARTASIDSRSLPAAVLASDGQANTEIANLIERLGFAALDLGLLSEGGRLQHFGGPLVSQNVIRRLDRASR